MKCHIKFRVTCENGKNEKIAIDLEEGRPGRLYGGSSGLEIISAIMGGPTLTACNLFLRNGGLVVTKGEQGTPLMVNGKPFEEFLISRGDKLSFERGTIEFLDVPVPPPSEDVTRLVRISDLARAPEVKAELPYEEPVDGATQMIMRKDLRPRVKAAPTSPDPIVHETGASDSVTREIPRPSGPQTWTFSRFRPALRLILSFLVIGSIVEFASVIAFGAKYEISPVPFSYCGLAAIVVVSLFCGIFHLRRRALGIRGSFTDYVLTFAGFSVILIPFSWSFSFPPSVIVLASLLTVIAWITVFGVRHFSEVKNFLPVSGVAWIAVIGLSFYLFENTTFDSEDHSSNSRDRKIASAPESAAQPAPPLTPPATPATVPIAVVQPVVEPGANVLDPMAKEQFFNAVKSGNLAAVQSLVDGHQIDPVFTLEFGSSALHFAAAQGDLAMVKYLVSKKANIDGQDAGGTTPLMWATYRDHLSVVKYLIQKKVRLDIRREGGDRAIDLAIRSRDAKLFTVLKEAARKRSIAGKIAGRHKKRK